MEKIIYLDENFEETELKQAYFAVKTNFENNEIIEEKIYMLSEEDQGNNEK